MKALKRALTVIAIAAVIVPSIVMSAEASQRRIRKLTPKDDPPICLSVTAPKTQLRRGERVLLQANGAHPDGKPLEWTWTATGGAFEGNGATVTYVAPADVDGTFTITARTHDDYGHTVECSITLQVGASPEDR
jgi:hypothetical protein